MSRCSIDLSIAEPEKSYTYGDKVSCKLNIKVPRNLKCNEVNLNLMTRTHGKGNQSSNFFETVVLRKGNLKAGSYHFEHDFHITDGTPTYRGSIVNVDWYVTARVDIPWAIDVTDEVDFIVMPSENYKYDNEKKAMLENKNKSSAFLVVFLSFLIFHSVCTTIMVLLIQPPLFVSIIFILAILFLFSIVMFKKIKSWILSRKFSMLNLSISKTFVKKKDSITSIFEAKSKKHAHLLDYELSLIGMEIAISGSGTDQITHTHTFYQKVITSKKMGTLKAGHKLIEKNELTIPIDAPPSFQSNSNYVTWKVSAKLGIDNYPDWKEEKIFYVM